MKKLALLALLIAAPAFSADLMPQGTFTGTGEWHGPDGSTGRYTIVTTTTGASITSNYVYEAGGKGPREQALTLTLVATGGGFFTVADEKGATVGRGYCLGSECFWTTEFPGGSVEETLRFDGATLEKLGGKHGPGFTVAWRETLTKQ